jgi:hypothetical protein
VDTAFEDEFFNGLLGEALLLEVNRHPEKNKFDVQTNKQETWSN